MFLPPFFLQDVRQSLKETLMDYTVWKEWRHRFQVLIHVVLYLWVVPGFTLLFGKIFHPERYKLLRVEVSTQTVWQLFLYSIFGFIIYEILSFLWHVIHKTGVRRNERWKLKHSKKCAHAA